MTHHIRDFLDITSAPTQQGKRTTLFEANLVKTGSVLPYYMGGKIVWMWKDPDHWYTPDVVSQFDNLVMCDEHCYAEWSHNTAVGLIRDPALAEPFIKGTCAIFKPDMIESILEGKNQLSADALVTMTYIGREINGQWVDYAQQSPRLDHIAIVQKGRQGDELTLTLQQIKDGGLDLGSTAFELSLEQAHHKIVISDQIQTEIPMKTVPELEADLLVATTQLGDTTSKLVQMTDAHGTVQAELATAQATIATLSTTATPEAAAQLATEGMALYNAATSIGLEVSMSDCITAPLPIYRNIKETLVPNSATTIQISDEMLPAFCSALLIARNSNLANDNAAAPATVETVAPDAPEVAATFSLADALQTAPTRTQDVVITPPATGAPAKRFALPNPLAKAPAALVLK